MAILNQTDRIAISSRLANIEKELKLANQAIADANAAVVEAIIKDDPNIKLIADKDVIINPYQNELKFIDGNTRTELSEDVFLDSVNRVLNNSFFPNDPTKPLASIPDGVWKNLVPFAGTHAIGKTSLEVYTPNRNEMDILDEINAQIAEMEALVIARRITGKECVEGVAFGFCTGASGSDESTCTGNGGVWTPSSPDYYQSDPIVVPGLANLEALVEEWETVMNSQKNAIPVADETDAARIAGNTAAIIDIDAAILVLDVWQAVKDYDTATGLPGSCSTFNSRVEGNFQQAKMSPTTLAPLKAEIAARSAYVIVRENELNSADYLGSIGQNLETGDITSFIGLYGDRMLLIDLRVNTLAGTLNKTVGATKATVFQESFKTSSNNAEAALSQALTNTRAVAPGINTKYLNVKDASEFNVGDRVFVVADKQKELSGSIEEIANNRVKLTFSIPKKYTIDNNTRLYKVL